MTLTRVRDMALLVVILGVILFVGVNAWSTAADITLDQTGSGDRIQTHQTLDGGGTWHTLAQEQGVDETVTTSRGYAIELSGAPDSYFQSSESIPMSANWSVSVWATVDTASATANMTVLSLDGRLVLTYNGSASEWRAWYYDDGTRTSYTASVPAPNQPNSFTNLVVSRNQTHLQLWRDNTAHATVDVTTENFADAPVNATTFDGRIEELRVFNTTLSNAQRQNLYTDPVAPYTYNRSARVMFDEPYRDQQLLLFAPGSIHTSNVSYGEGFAGRDLDRSDYDWRQRGPQIRVDSTTLPVVYIDYTRTGIGVLGFVQSLEAGLVLLGVLIIIIAAGVVLYVLNGTRRR